MSLGYRLEADEHIILKTRRHWIDLAPVFLVAVVLFAAVGYFALAYPFYSRQLNVSAPIVGYILVVVLLLAMVILAIGLYVYQQNYLILTNLHLIQIEQSGLFGRQVSQLSLARLQDVSGKRNGFLETILNYGNMEVQSAGEHEKFIFRNAPAPEDLAEMCLEAHEDFMRAAGMRSTDPSLT